MMLALLARHQIRATFCLIGRHAAAYPALVSALIDAGHQIANHTYTHPIPISRLPTAQLRDELARTSDTIATITGHPPTLFRSPGGIWTPDVLATCAEAGMRPLDWSVDPRDWSRPGAGHITKVILTHTRPGSIILEHDGGGNRQQTLDALTIALPRLLDAGYQFTQP
jgi:peptidoglycan-N-acetylglucosamine deacetylase